MRKLSGIAKGCRDKNEGKQSPNANNKQALSSKKKPKDGLSDCAEDF